MARSNRTPMFRTAVGILSVGVAFALTGCTSASDPESETLPPVIVDINEIDGTTVEVAEGNVIDLTGDDETYLDWTGEIADPAIAEFTPGKEDGSAQFNPGITGLSVGQTEVTLDNSTSGDSVTFTVEVTAPVN